MTYLQDCREFAAIMEAEGMDTGDILELFELANRAQRYAVLACNYGLTERQEKNDAKNDDRIRTLVNRYPGFSAVFSGDPRGAVVKIQVPSGRTNDWGQKGICVPTRNY